MKNEVAKQSDAIVAALIINGDLSRLSPAQKVEYYNGYCQRLGLDPFTKPFEILKLGDKEVMYCTRSGAQQLNKLHKVSHTITAREIVNGCYVVTSQASTPDGRRTESIGAVPITKEGGEWKQSQSGKKYFESNGKVIDLRGDDLCNAMMKAESKSKRRASLDLLGLGVLDESEVETIPGARKVTTIDTTAEVSNLDMEKVEASWFEAVEDCKTKNDLIQLYEGHKEEVDKSPELKKLFRDKQKEFNKVPA